MPEERSVLSRLSTTLEEATDKYAEACNAEAEAENAYLRAFHLAWITKDEVPTTIRVKDTDNVYDVVEAKCSWNLAKSLERSRKAKTEELRHRLMAAMSHQKFVAAQT